VSLEEEIKKTLNNFENASSETILEIIDQIRPHFRSELTSEYLSGKIKKIQNESDDATKKNQCRALLPYFDWYLQGL
jgi:hypothetical protein